MGLTGRMELSGARIVGHRLWATGLDRRRASGVDALRATAHAGLQDSVPRAAVLSIHARLHGVPADVLDDPALEQVWGPRFNVFVVAVGDRAPFTVGRLPRRGAQRDRALVTADVLRSHLGDRTMSYADAGREMGVHHNALRYAAPTGTVVIGWEGSGRPTIRCVDPPDVDEEDARLELARRYLHVFGPADVDAFSRWAGVTVAEARCTFRALADELVPVNTPLGDAVVLASDEASFGCPEPAEGVRLLPSGDASYLLWGDQRRLLVGDEARRSELWTSRVWPGALLLHGEIVGTWRRRGTDVTIDAWRVLSGAERAAVDGEIAGLPVFGRGSQRMGRSC